jgi:hypothetical protein
MPKLLIFAACEKIIVDEGHNVSLIVLMQNVDVSIIQNTEVAHTAISPQAWAVFSMWQTLPEDVGKQLVQIVQIVWPDKSEFKRIQVPFQLEADKAHHNKITIIGFPAGQVGVIAINLWIEENSRQLGDTYTYPINVTHKNVAPQ